MHVHLVEHMDDVLRVALDGPLPPAIPPSPESELGSGTELRH
jgi:hypothetical protein